MLEKALAVENWNLVFLSTHSVNLSKLSVFILSLLPYNMKFEYCSIF